MWPRGILLRTSSRRICARWCKGNSVPMMPYRVSHTNQTVRHGQIMSDSCLMLWWLRQSELVSNLSSENKRNALTRSYEGLNLSSSSGWWFGTCFTFPYIGNFIIPIDFHIFQRGRSTTNQSCLKAFGWRGQAHAILPSDALTLRPCWASNSTKSCHAPGRFAINKV